MSKKRRWSRKRTSAWPRLLPLLAAFSGLTLLPLLLLSPLWWQALSGGTEALRSQGLWAATTLALAALFASGLIWGLALFWSRRLPAVARAAALPSPSSAVAIVPAPPTPNGRLDRDRVPAPSPDPADPGADCLIDEGLWHDLQEHLHRFPRQEQGGFVLGYRKDGRSYFSAVIFPKQVTATGTLCEFPTEDVTLIREVCDALVEQTGAEQLSTVTAWIHTHPNLRVFLSSTDCNTLKQWLGLDPHTRAVVVDVFAGGFKDQVGVFDGQFRRVRAAVAPLPLPGELCEQFLRQVRQAYGRRNRPVPEVFLASAAAPAPQCERA